MLISSLPKTAAEAAALRRARQLTDFRWTPLRDIPTYTKKDGNFLLPAGVEVMGFPYSSTELQDKFIGENVTVESFLSQISNPHSKLYAAGHGEHSAPNVGLVCNGLARYALGISRRVSTRCWLSIPGMKKVAERQTYTVEDMRLLDVLYAFGDGRNHVALVTDILRNESGEIVEIEVSEAIRPLCVRHRFAADEFIEKHFRYHLCRYEHLEQVPPLDEETDALLWSDRWKETPSIAVDHGEGSNYLVGEEALLSVNSSEPDEVELIREGEIVKTYPVGGSARFPLKLERGYYTARLRGKGAEAHFCFCEAEVRYESENGILTVSADPCDRDSEILYMDFRREGVGCSAMETYEELTDSEKQSGHFARPIPPEAKHFKVYYRNAYGVWTHPMKRI